MIEEVLDFRFQQQAALAHLLPLICPSHLKSSVAPAKAGAQVFASGSDASGALDSRCRGNDEIDR